MNEIGVAPLIHQTWKHPYLARPLRYCVDSFHKLNPGWKCCFYTDEECEEFVRREYSNFFPAYLKYPPGIMRADIFRVLVLHRLGGVYADVDVECLRPLEELLQAVAGQSWEILLSTDHPIHERVHYDGRKMWMNDFMIARPGSRFLERVIAAFEANADGPHDSRNAVFATGPGLFSTVVEHVGSAEMAGITPIPWNWIHPLPDMTVRFAERDEYLKAILTRSWRTAAAPFVVHYWYHTWSAEENTLTRFAHLLHQSDGELVEERLQPFVGLLGESADRIGHALTHFAERSFDFLLEIHRSGTRLRSAEERRRGKELGGDPGRNAPPCTCQAGVFHHVATEVLRNLGVRHLCWGERPDEGSDCACEIAQLIQSRQPSSNGTPWSSLPTELGAECREQAGLVYFWEGDVDDGARLTAADEAEARFIVERNVVRPGGYVILDCPAGDSALRPGSQLARIFEEAGFIKVAGAGNRLLQRPDFAIPKTIHLLPIGLSGAPMPARTKRWLQAHLAAGWTCRRWSDQELGEYVARGYPELYDVIVGRGQGILRYSVGLLILHEFGGVLADEAMPWEAELAELLSGQRLVLFAESMGTASNRKTLLSSRLMASVPRHPFWSGLSFDLRARETGKKDFDPSYLTRRAQACLKFLEERDHPTILDLFTFTTPLAETPGAATAASGDMLMNSRLCGEEDFRTSWFQHAAVELGETLRFHRHLWEMCFIFQAFRQSGMLARGRQGLAIVERESSLLQTLQHRGCDLAVVFQDGDRKHQDRLTRWIKPRLTRRDYPAEVMEHQTGQVRPVKPLAWWKNAEDRERYDFIYSQSAMHLCPDVETAKEMLLQAGNRLRPGGVAVFTTEFNLSSEAAKEEGDRLYFRRAEIEEICAAMRKAGLELTLDLSIGSGEIESQVSMSPAFAIPHLRVQFGGNTVTSFGLILRRSAAALKVGKETASRFSEGGFLYVDGSLGDLVRHFYTTHTYELLNSIDRPTPVICCTETPAALEFFRFHPNHENLLLFDLGHLCTAWQAEGQTDRRLNTRRAVAESGFATARHLACWREATPLRYFHCPDPIANTTNHIVIHPFGDRWGNWPEATCEVLREVLRSQASGRKIYVLGADFYLGASPRIEDFVCDLPQVTLVKNRSLPAVFSLIARASHFIGSMSALAQVAAFERRPSLILHPAHCTDLLPPCSEAGEVLHRFGSECIAFDAIEPAVLRDRLASFLAEAGRNSIAV